MFIIYLLYSILLCVVVLLVLALTPETKLKSFMTTMLYILYNIYQNNVYLFNTRRVIEKKPWCMASNDLTFSLIVYIKYTIPHVRAGWRPSTLRHTWHLVKRLLNILWSFCLEISDTVCLMKEPLHVLSLHVWLYWISYLAYIWRKKEMCECA
jgi:hypothetical protein